MLGLKSTTNPEWAKIVEDNLGVFLTDHAFAEQKAAAGGFLLIISYSEETEFVKALSEYTIEETEHFKLVHDFMISRGYTLGRDQKSNYAAHLLKFARAYQDKSIVNQKWDELLTYEAA